MIVFIPAECAPVCGRADAVKDVRIGDRRHRNQFAALEHRREIHKVLTRSDTVFPNLGNLRSQEPMPVGIVTQLRRGLHRGLAGGLAAIGLYLFHGTVPQISISIAWARKIR